MWNISNEGQGSKGIGVINKLKDATRSCREQRKKKVCTDNSNGGMTLVELLVAFAVSAIILSGLAYMMITTLHLYGRTNANVEVQNESQTALNLVIDSILGAKGVCYIEEDMTGLLAAPDALTCALFGELVLHDGGVPSMTFTGDAVLWQPSLQEMYMISGTYDLGTYSSEAKAPLEAIAAMKTKLPADEAGRLPYLMAQNVTVFELKALDSCFVEKVNKPEDEMTEEEKKNADKYFFENPLVIHVNMEFEYQYQKDKFVSRQMDDNVSVRNRLDYVYLQRQGGSMIKYLRNPK